MHESCATQIVRCRELGFEGGPPRDLRASEGFFLKGDLSLSRPPRISSRKTWDDALVLGLFYWLLVVFTRSPTAQGKEAKVPCVSGPVTTQFVPAWCGSNLRQLELLMLSYASSSLRGTDCSAACLVK